ncbi:MAG: MoxR family ATPase [Verrucomicrobia bacterium]|nr:MoxR family ATPase [Verrucomicrobiota bacterium]
MSIEESTRAFLENYKRVREQIEKVIVGHHDIVEGTLISLFAGGHVLLEGVPGLGKTLLVRALSRVLDLSFSRIQFTPDLMPADILGTNIVMETSDGRKHFEFQRGPIFAHMVLADEINRATPKTQSALLEAMQEQNVTAGGMMRPLDKPFFVLATQNPIDQEGTYPLPEAQVDRFFFKLIVTYPLESELMEVLRRTTQESAPVLDKALDGPAILSMQTLVRQIVAATHVMNYAARLTMASHPGSPYATDLANRFLRFGSSPRGAQTLILAAKVLALVDGRYNVSFDDIRKAARPALRHRLLINFEGEAEGITSEKIIEEMLAKTPTEAKTGS